MFQTTKLILEAFDNDEFYPIIIIGNHSIGKSGFAESVIADVYGHVFNHGTPLWDNFTPLVQEWFGLHLGFMPRHVLDEWQFPSKREQWLLKEFGGYPRSIFNDWQYEDKKKDYVYHWDDSGLWLHNLDFQNPFVKNTGKYMQVVKTDWACVMFSAISAEDVMGKIRGLRDAIIIEITKNSDTKHPDRRIAEAYVLRKSFKNKIWKETLFRDTFSRHMPDPFFAWYHPIRSKYAGIAKQLMRKKLDEDEDINIDTKESL